MIRVDLFQGDWIPDPDAARHEDDVPGHCFRHAQPGSRLHLRYLRLSRVLPPATGRGPQSTRWDELRRRI